MKRYEYRVVCLKFDVSTGQLDEDAQSSTLELGERIIRVFGEPEYNKANGSPGNPSGSWWMNALVERESTNRWQIGTSREEITELLKKGEL